MLAIGPQEWRTTLHLRNLTWKLCDEGTLQAFLQRSGLMESIEKISVKPGGGHRSGSATLRVANVSEVAKVAKFFHGRMFPGNRSPVAVSFAESCGGHFRAPEPFKVPPPRLGYRGEALPGSQQSDLARPGSLGFSSGPAKVMRGVELVWQNLRQRRVSLSLKRLSFSIISVAAIRQRTSLTAQWAHLLDGSSAASDSCGLKKMKPSWMVTFTTRCNTFFTKKWPCTLSLRLLSDVFTT
eukprot:g22971.t1